VTRPDMPPPLSGQERADALERVYTEDRRYWASVDRSDRHSPAPDCWWTCETHGKHRCITGCPKCRDTEWERAA
jgi:hypothetical protein